MPYARTDWLIRTAIWSFAVSLSVAALCQTALAQSPPHYKVDPFWPKELPNNWIVGQIGGMAVDRKSRHGNQLPYRILTLVGLLGRRPMAADCSSSIGTRT